MRVQEWNNVFRHFDRDRSGSIDQGELRQALTQFGYNLSPNLLSLLERKYGMPPSSPLSCYPDRYLTALPVFGVDVNKASAPSFPGGAPPGISFDRFVRACVVIKTLTESFQRLDNDRDGWIQINYDQFMQTVLSAP